MKGNCQPARFASRTVFGRSRCPADWHGDRCPLSCRRALNRAGGGATMAATVTPLTPAVGAEIGHVDLRVLSDADFTVIERAWHRYSALLFRDQQLSDDDLLAFSRRFGELDSPPNQERGRQTPPGYPDIYVVSNVLDEKGDPIGALGAGEAVWHTDMSYVDVPPDASMLYALEIPPTGGNTSLCGMQAAWAS